jgi:DNA-binding LacI/PurR family transcriptional regulator
MVRLPACPDLTGNIEAIEAIAAKNPEGVIVQPLYSHPDYSLQFNEKNVPLCFVNIAPENSETSKNLEYY